MLNPGFLLLAAISVVLAGCSEPPEPQTTPPPLPERSADRAGELARNLLIVDTHIDVPYRLHKAAADVSVATDGGDFDFPRAVAGGLNALFMSIYIPAAVDSAGDAKPFADDLIDLVEGLVSNAPEQFALATCTGDLAAISAAGKIAFPLGMENGGPIGGNFDNLRHFSDRGIRYITLAHSKSNHISDSSYDTDEHWQGLSEFGKTLIPEMNRLGVMVDVSHISDLAYWQVLELTQVPVIASHSSLRHFTPGFQRNMTDEMVTALGDNGGVIQINFGSSFLTAEARAYADTTQQAVLKLAEAQQIERDDPRLADIVRQYQAENPYPFATLDDVLDHIDRAVELAGIDHVGLGSDYDGVGNTLPTGLKDVSQYPNLVQGLIDRGYADEDIAKVLGGNLMRVWTAVESFAAEAGNPAACSHS